MSLSWVCCPHCKESVQLERQGAIGKIGTRTIRKRGVKIGKKLKVTDSKKIKCLCCGTFFYSEEPTMQEAMGRDGHGNTAF